MLIPEPQQDWTDACWFGAECALAVVCVVIIHRFIWSLLTDKE